MSGTRVMSLWAMNFGPPGKDGHTRAKLAPEVHNLCHHPRGDRQSKLGFVTEGIGWKPLPHVQGQQIIHNPNAGAGVANVGLYVGGGLDVQDVDYVHHTQGWSRIEHPGQHMPRVTLKARIKGDDGKPLLAVATHGPDPRADNPQAKTEWVRIMADIIESSQIPVLMGGDPNHLFDDVVRAVGNPLVVVSGEGADAVLSRGYVFTSGRKYATVGGLRFTNDHHGAYMGRAVRRRSA